jgi:hypothetical protein
MAGRNSRRPHVCCCPVTNLLDDPEVDMTNHDQSRDAETVDAVGKATEALEYIERARGHLYAFHQLVGRADFLFEESAQRLAAAGRPDAAASLWRSLVGRDVLEGRWTFEIVERFDDDYYEAARAEVTRLEQRLVGGRRHGHEEALRQRRRGEHPRFLGGSNDPG